MTIYHTRVGNASIILYLPRTIDGKQSIINGYPAQFKRFVIYGLSEVEEFSMVFDRHANLKYKYGNRHFWCRGYYVNTAGADTHAIEAYIRNQLSEDQAIEQMTFREYIDPFTGCKNTKA